eukprot:TRINITY_DN14472_c0_g1_i2.p1 TRINITY_DN14472_c0_g1~~TRINITY_DN14472_c0_g1_i2.p1  ORF type:complete len:140 (-),score=23.37 TRINITY_DN14472_c0_g1_i2:194-613(-)
MLSQNFQVNLEKFQMTQQGSKQWIIRKYKPKMREIKLTQNYVTKNDLNDQAILNKMNIFIKRNPSNTIINFTELIPIMQNIGSFIEQQIKAENLVTHDQNEQNNQEPINNYNKINIPCLPLYSTKFQKNVDEIIFLLNG